jgi:LysM repeat protein
MGEDKKSGSSVKNPNAVFAALGVVAVVILAALMAVWSHIGYQRPATQSQAHSDHQVSSQSPSGRGSVSENQQSGVPPVKPVDTQKPSETPGDEKDPVPPAVQPVDGSNVNDGRGASIYIVQPGDTLSSISAATGVSVDKIAQANSLVDVNCIYKESALVIPSSQ